MTTIDKNKAELEATITQLEAETDVTATQLYTETLSPILRNVSGYKGDFTVNARSKFVFDATSGFTYSITLSLSFPSPTYGDIWEEAQRMILATALEAVVERS